MSLTSPAPQPTAVDPWGELVARQAQFQATIEAALDCADACEDRGDYERALDSLDRASALSGGLSATCLGQWARCARGLEEGKR